MRPISPHLTRFACAWLVLSALAVAAPPKVTALFPAGLARGTEATINATGEFSNWPSKVWVDRPGLTIEPGKEKGQLAVKADADCTPGVFWIRLHDAEGASELRPLVVGQIAEAAEKEPNNSLAAAQMVTLPVTINARVLGSGKGGDSDVFSVSLAKGDVLAAALDANWSLGSPMDGVLQVVTADGSVIAQNHDEVGVDPRIVLSAPADGKYYVRVFAFPLVADSRVGIAGGETFVYRLTLTTTGLVDYAMPLAVTRGAAASVALQGIGIPPELATIAITPPTEGAASLSLFQPQLAGVAPVAVVSSPVALDAEPNDVAHPQAITLPLTICGRLDEPRDSDVYSFTAEAKQKAQFRIESRALGFPTDPVLRVLDGEGKVVIQVDDKAKEEDAELLFVAPATGTYRLEVRDLYRRGGPRFAYRVFAGPPEPSLAVTVSADAFTAIPGKPLEIPLKIERVQGFSDEVDFTIEGLPANVTVAPVKSLVKGDTAKAVKLVVTAADSAMPGGGPIRIVGKSADGVTRTAQATLAAFNRTTSDLWLTVSAKK